MIESSYFISIVAATITGCVTALYLYFLRFKLKRERMKPFLELPSPPGWHWAAGHLIMLGKSSFQHSLAEISMTHANEYGQTGFWLAQTRAISITNAFDSKAVLHSSNFRSPIRHVRRHMDRFLGSRNIVLLSGKEWKYHRAAILRAFSPTAVEHAQHAVLDLCSVLLTALRPKDGTVMNVEPLLKMMTIDIFGRTALSRDLQCCATLQPSNIAKAFDFMGREFTRRLYQPMGITSNYYWIPTALNREYARQRTLIRSFIQDIVTERKDMTTSPPQDLLTCLLQAHADLASDPTDAVSNQTLTDILMSLLFAGYDTTSITLTYALYNLAKHPKVEQECLKEIQRLNSDTPDPDALFYCRAVLLETLRLYPPANATTRNLTKDLKLEGGFVAKKGLYVYIPIWVIQRKAEYFPSPEEFIPERWATKNENDVWEERGEDDIQPNTIAPANRSAFLAFSAGARSCAGQRFALMEATLVLASMIKEISFSVEPDYVVEPERAGIVQRPKGGMPMKLQFRKC